MYIKQIGKTTKEDKIMTKSSVYLNRLEEKENKNKTCITINIVHWSVNRVYQNPQNVYLKLYYDLCKYCPEKGKPGNCSLDK